MNIIDEFTINKIHRRREEVEIESCLNHQGRNTGCDIIRCISGSAI